MGQHKRTTHPRHPMTLQDMRQHLGLSQSQVAEALGGTQSAVTKLEKAAAVSDQ